MKKISVVVSSYARFPCIQKLVESARRIFPKGEYEVVAVCSDHPESSKAQWLKAQDDVVYIQGDVRLTHRLRSLYAYENMGIKAAQGEWIFVTNDDTEFDDGFWHCLEACGKNWDVILTSGHLGDVGLGCRKAIIGTITPPGKKTENLYLYDFAVIRKWVYEAIGYLDENLDWFGKGFDLAMACEVTPGLRISYSEDIKINHSIDGENRLPPHYARDFQYATNKWTKWCAENGWKFTWPW
jgi:hypothetical protein